MLFTAEYEYVSMVCDRSRSRPSPPTSTCTSPFSPPPNGRRFCRNFWHIRRDFGRSCRSCLHPSFFTASGCKNTSIRATHCSQAAFGQRRGLAPSLLLFIKVYSKMRQLASWRPVLSTILRCYHYLSELDYNFNVVNYFSVFFFEIAYFRFSPI